MKRLILLLLLVPFIGYSTKYYCSPTGSDDHAGTYASPFFTINKAMSVMSAGDTCYMRGGTYQYTGLQYNKTKSGSAGHYYNIWNYPGEVPIITKSGTFDASTGNDEGVGVNLIYLNGVGYIYIKGLTITGNTQPVGDNQLYRAILGYSIHHCTFENLNVYGNSMGVLVSHNSYQDHFINSDFHHNFDPQSSYGNGDGLQIAYIDSDAVSDTNFVTGCRAWNNADDGFDSHHGNGLLIYDRDWAWHNGYREDGTTAGGNGDGFKLGDSDGDLLSSTKRICRNCLSFYNRLDGFDQNNGFFRMILYNNTSYGNVRDGYRLSNDDATKSINMTMVNNISYGNSGVIAYVNRNGTLTTNTFKFGSAPSTVANTELCTLTSEDFISLDSTGVSSPRATKKDSWGTTLPSINFLQLASGSDMVNVGTNVGISYYGSAPDLGAFELYPTVISGRIVKTVKRVVKQTGQLIKQ